MEVIIRPDQQAAIRLCSRIIARRIREKPDLVLGLATGRTMEPLYAELVRLHREEQLSFSSVTTFNLDEYIGLPAEHPQSYRFYMNQHLLSQVDIDPRFTYLPDGMASDIPAACEAYERLIGEVGGIELQLLGIGNDGHIGFNEPGSSLRSVTRHKTLNAKTIAQNRTLFPNPEDMPTDALTMGLGTIFKARYCLMLVTGASKADIVARALEGPVTSMVTASAMQFHPDFAVILDEPAAATLQLRDYHRWAYDHKPAWQRLD
jgi:glucosamine-6-phosphate deaminase